MLADSVVDWEFPEQINSKIILHILFLNLGSLTSSRLLLLINININSKICTLETVYKVTVYKVKSVIE